MNEAETRAELIDPKLREKGWGVIEETKVLREYNITKGKIRTGQTREKPLIADYVLTYRGRKLAVIEAKKSSSRPTEGVAQAKEYAQKLHLKTTFSTNGKEIYQICMETGKEEYINNFPSPEELWIKTFPISKTTKLTQIWKDKFNSVPLGGHFEPRFYQEIAINKTLEAIAENKQRLLLTLATGTGKTAIAFQIAWKLFQTRWNLQKDAKRRPRILFLADRNILANQAFNSFNSFPEDALIRINPKEIRKNGKVPTNGSIFFTIFQTFMSGEENKANFGQYPKDYFDFIIIDECHRGGAKDESEWKNILEYFSQAVQLGLTATPKRKSNADTYKYFGKPLYQYSLKEGINDGYLTPFRVRTIKTTLDEYSYSKDDIILEGEIEQGKIYKEVDFNRIIEIKEREAYRVSKFMNEINQNEKTIVFCATQDHALAVRDLINQYKKSKEINYCVRVTANDGELGEQYLREFQDNEKLIPTILTTSYKLSTGVDARNIRNIVLMRQVNSIIEFKQIVGRGTRLFEGKDFFTIYDFVNAYHNFNDPEWDGEPIEEIVNTKKYKNEENLKPFEFSKEDNKKLEPITKIKLREGKEREIQSMSSTLFFDKKGKPILAEEFLKNLYGDLPNFFKNEVELRRIWSNPVTRKELLERLSNSGYDLEKLKNLQKLVNAENSDLFDVLDYIAFNVKPISREKRVANAQSIIFKLLTDKEKEFLEFILSKYIDEGIEELNEDKLPDLLKLKYHAINDAINILGNTDKIKKTFTDFQKYLYV